MKIEKKLVTLSVIALVLGIIIILPIIVYTPLAVEHQNFPFGFRIVNVDPPTDVRDIPPDFADNLPKWVAVLDTDFSDGENCTQRITLMPIDEFYEIYGPNAEIPKIPFWLPEPGE